MRFSDSDGPVPLSLPPQWLWDIIDEFLYQFQSFCTWRSKVHPKTDEELSLLGQDSGQVWSCYSVLNVLYSFIQKSGIQSGQGSDEPNGEGCMTCILHEADDSDRKWSARRS